MGRHECCDPALGVGALCIIPCDDSDGGSDGDNHASKAVGTTPPAVDTVSDGGSDGDNHASKAVGTKTPAVDTVSHSTEFSASNDVRWLEPAVCAGVRLPA